MVAVSKKLGLEYVLPVMEPFPLIDTPGIGITVCILPRSLDNGRYQNTM